MDTAIKNWSFNHNSCQKLWSSDLWAFVLCLQKVSVCQLKRLKRRSVGKL